MSDGPHRGTGPGPHEGPAPRRRATPPHAPAAPQRDPGAAPPGSGDAPSTGSDAAAPVAPVTRSRGALAILLTTSFMGILDVLIVNVAAPSIQRDLNAGFADVQLVISGYVLAYAVGLTTGGRLGDSHGKRRLLRIGLVAFALLSAACAAAPTVGVLVVCRFAQGFAAALMLPQVLALIQDILPKAERPRAVALYAATLGLGAVVGQIVGGLLIRADVLGLGWRAVFLVNVPVGLLAAALAPRFIPETRARRAPLDVPGLLLTAAAMSLLIFPLIQAGSQGRPRWILAGCAGAAVALRLLWPVERRRHAAGRAVLLPPPLLRQRRFRTGLAAALFFYAGNYGLFLLLAYVFQDGLRLTPLASGVAFLPLGAGFAAASVAGRRLADRHGPVVLLWGTATMVLGYAVLVVTLVTGPASSGATQALVMAPALLVSGVGQGLVSAPLIATVLAGVRREDAGAGSGIVLTVNQLASAVGVAVCGALFTALLGADPQVGAAPADAFLSALTGCAWLLLALAVVTGVLLRRMGGGRGPAASEAGASSVWSDQRRRRRHRRRGAHPGE
ncbi:MFS transporter, partial [Streptomyces sp. NPDC005805]|uniref:MFS transporter n=1 Tax=Streptomyces sp. NPDC005805 TaxID=3157068 RepID=UPI0033C259B2